jgi:hypothetical protein
MHRSLLTSLTLGLVLATGTAAAAGGPALPPLGEHTYDLSGISSFGPVPTQLELTVADAGGEAQKWTLDATNRDGSGLIEQLTLTRRADGLYLSGYHLQAAGSVAAVDLMFNPTPAVLLVPDGQRSWTFDMTSADGCVKTHTAANASGTGSRQVHLATQAAGTGKSGCEAMDAKRTQDIRFPGTSYLPNRIDTDLSGHMGGGTAAARLRATLRPGR